jgi:hypothetical protein
MVYGFSYTSLFYHVFKAVFTVGQQSIFLFSLKTLVFRLCRSFFFLNINHPALITSIMASSKRRVIRRRHPRSNQYNPLLKCSQKICITYTPPYQLIPITNKPSHLAMSMSTLQNPIAATTAISILKQAMSTAHPRSTNSPVIPHKPWLNSYST